MSPVRPTCPLEDHTLQNIEVPGVVTIHHFFCFFAPVEELWPTWNDGHQTHGSMNRSILPRNTWGAASGRVQKVGLLLPCRMFGGLVDRTLFIPKEILVPCYNAYDKNNKNKEKQ